MDLTRNDTLRPHLCYGSTMKVLLDRYLNLGPELLLTGHSGLTVPSNDV